LKGTEAEMHSQWKGTRHYWAKRIWTFAETWFYYFLWTGSRFWQAKVYCTETF